MDAKRASGIAAAGAALLVGWTPRWTDTDWPLAALARRCADVDVAGTEVRVHCAADGSVGAIEAPVDYALADRAGAGPLAAWDVDGAAARRGGGGVSAGPGPRGVAPLHWPARPRVMGRAWLLRPAHAPPAVLAAAQRAAELPEAPPLRTVDGWRRALERATRRPAP